MSADFLKDIERNGYYVPCLWWQEFKVPKDNSWLEQSQNLHWNLTKMDVKILPMCCDHCSSAGQQTLVPETI